MSLGRTRGDAIIYDHLDFLGVPSLQTGGMKSLPVKYYCQQVPFELCALCTLPLLLYFACDACEQPNHCCGELLSHIRAFRRILSCCLILLLSRVLHGIARKKLMSFVQKSAWRTQQFVRCLVIMFTINLNLVR